MPTRPVTWRLAWPLAGGALGALAWLVFARPDVNTQGLEIFERPAAVAAERHGARLILTRLDSIQTFGVFPKADMPAGEGAAPDAGALKLVGTSVSPARKAALVSVGGATPVWIAIGAPASGLELVELNSTQAVIRSASGQTTTLSLYPAVDATTAANPLENDATQ